MQSGNGNKTDPPFEFIEPGHVVCWSIAHAICEV
jgi:hypothetical protein